MTASISGQPGGVLLPGASRSASIGFAVRVAKGRGSYPGIDLAGIADALCFAQEVLAGVLDRFFDLFAPDLWIAGGELRPQRLVAFPTNVATTLVSRGGTSFASLERAKSPCRRGNQTYRNGTRHPGIPSLFIGLELPPLDGPGLARASRWLSLFARSRSRPG